MTVRILHLEDSPADASLVEGTLAGAGLPCQITCVQDRESFSSTLALIHAFDVVLSDNQLPSFDGLSALRLVRDRDPLLPFIFVSGTMGEEAAVRSLTSGATDYVLKGNLTRLPAAITRALDTARERRQRGEAEAALRTSEARYRALVETAWDWVWAIDAGGIFTFSNDAGTRTTGYTPAELLGRSWMDIIHQDDVGVAERVLQQCLAGRGPVLGSALRCWHRDGSVRSLEMSATPVLDTAGQVSGFRGSTRDVTERLKLEMQLHHSQKMEALGVLAGSIAHDFNNLLMAVMVCTELVLNELADDSPVREHLESIEQATAHGATLTKQLLTFSRQQSMQLARIDIPRLIGGIEHMLRRLIGSDIHVVVRAEPDLPQVRADRGQLEQVLVNLAVNARDAMSPGGTLTIDTFTAMVDDAEVERYPDATVGRHVVIAVRDTGAGIDEATLVRIFDPFFTTKATGTGLGLSTVYGIVRQAGGHIRVETAPGRGTAFLVYLPANAIDVGVSKL